MPLTATGPLAECAGCSYGCSCSLHWAVDSVSALPAVLKWSNMGKAITTTEVTDNLLLLRPQTQRQTCVWKRAFSALDAVSHAGRQPGTGNCHSSGCSSSSGGQRPKRARLMSTMSLGQIERSFATDQLRASEKHNKTAYRPLFFSWTSTHLLSQWRVAIGGARDQFKWPFKLKLSTFCCQLCSLSLPIVKLTVSSTKHLSLDQWHTITATLLTLQ